MHLELDELEPCIEHPDLSGEVKFHRRIRVQVLRGVLNVNGFKLSGMQIDLTKVAIG